MNRIYILKNFKDYFNRETKMYDSIDGYLDYLCYGQDQTPGEFLIDFKENDGVNTLLKINWLGDMPNYVVVCEPELNGDILSRWFVMEYQRLRGGQYELTLHRDVIVDKWDKIVNAPMYIEKAIIPDSSPFIYNTEGLAFNQIKKSETLLKDETGVAWICGYIDNKTIDSPTITIDTKFVADYTASTFSEIKTELDFPFYINGNPSNPLQSYIDLSIKQIILRVLSLNPNSGWFRYTFIGDITSDNVEWRIDETRRICGVNEDPAETAFSSQYVIKFDKLQEFLNDRLPLMNTLVRNYFESTKDEEIASGTSRGEGFNISRFNIAGTLQDKIINITSPSDPKSGFNRCTLITRTERPIGFNLNDYSMTNIQQNLNSLITSYYGRVEERYTPYNIDNIIFFKYGGTVRSIRLQSESKAMASTTIVFPQPTERYHLKDAPYDMFCIPYGDKTISNSAASISEITISKEYAMSIAQSIARGLGSHVFDVQLLPYCPMSGFNITDSNIDINSSDTKRYTLITDTGTVPSATKGMIIWSTSSHGTKDINVDIPITNKKIQNECDIYRLVSPNYNGQFEFSAAKNNGISNIHVDYTYLPGSPYIHIDPTFNGLYGSSVYNDKHDARGLICQGDFSISLVNDKWVEYQIQNKNYENTFKREIQNMDTNRRYQRKQESWERMAGSIQGGISGAASASTVGPGAALTAAATGTLLSARGAALDKEISEGLYKESKAFSMDKFELNLDNVKALPQSIAKTTSYNENNKVFPILEYYSCTDEEKIILSQKIRHEGMTLGCVGTIGDYQQNNWSYNGISDRGFIKGRFFKLSSDEDFHMTKTLENEIEKGVYTKWE